MYFFRSYNLLSNLQVKVLQNQDRRERDELLKTLPTSINSIIDPEQYIYSYQLCDEFRILPGQDFKDSKFIESENFNSYQHVDFDDINHIKNYLEKNVMRFSPPLYCWFGSGPIFIINDNFESNFLLDIEKLSNYRIYIMEMNKAKGLIFDQYLGYLNEPRRTNNNEDVFELVSFS